MLPRRTILIVMGWLVSPAFALAGPIEFNYGVTTSVTAGTPDAGSVNFDLLAGGPVQFGEYGGSFTIGYISAGPSPGPVASDSYVAESAFDITLNITDLDGHSGSLTMLGSLIDEWILRSWDSLWLNPAHHLEFASDDLTFSTMIGENEYYLRAVPRNNGTEAAIILGVTPHTAGTPEPGTLALGAIGLLPVGWRLIRRRKAEQA